jgi:hypothetical protein
MPVASAGHIPGASYSREDLDVRFSEVQWIVNAAMIAIGVIFIVGVHTALVSINRHLAVSNGSTRLFILPQSAIWWFFPGFGALALSWDITLQLWGLLGNRETPRLYASWTSLKAGFDSTKMLRWMSAVVVLPIGVLTVLALPMHTALTQDSIIHCGYAFAPCKAYRYADAQRMTIVDGFRDRDARLTKRAGIVVDFRGGERWSSADEGDFHDQVDSSLEQFLTNRTHLPYGHAETTNDIPPLAQAQ